MVLRNNYKMLLQLLFALCFVTVSIGGSGVEFSASPTTIQPMLTDRVTLRCSLKDSSPQSAIIGRRSTDMTSRSLATDTTSIEYVTSIVITKDGVDVASMTEHIPAQALANSSDVIVAGSLVRRPGERGYLQVTLRYPTNQESGEYRCDITGVDKKGHSFDFSQTQEVTEEDITLKDVVRTMYALKKENDDMKQMLNTKVFFSVGVTSHLIVPYGQNVVYDKVFTNMGGGYDVTTGLFTCPVAGYYHLEINGLSQADKNFFFELQRNGQAVVVIYGVSGHSHQGSTNSVVLKLGQGDVLKVADMNSGSSAIYGTPSLIYSTFNGHLISLA